MNVIIIIINVYSQYVVHLKYRMLKSMYVPFAKMRFLYLRICESNYGVTQNSHCSCLLQSNLCSLVPAL